LLLRRLYLAATVAALAADYITHGGIGVTGYRATDIVHTFETLAHDVAGRIGDRADSLTSGIKKVADRAVDTAENAKVTRSSNLDVVITACGATILAGSLAGTITTGRH
jgi:hypothetical protein